VSLAGAAAWQREGVGAAAAAAIFAALCVLMHWPVHPLVAAVMVLAMWGLSLLLRRYRELTGLDGRDCAIAGGLVAVALVVRLASPIYLDFLQGNLDVVGRPPRPPASTDLRPTTSWASVPGDLGIPSTLPGALTYQ